ncbi:MAG: hypothetical protein QOF68_2134 [Gaiellales bacterium]|jgi:hypothetical protein|nr:hypothetical protein [Gaiellales bacterium]
MRQQRPLQIVSDGDIAWEDPAWVNPSSDRAARPRPDDLRLRRRRRPSRITILRRRLVALGVLGFAIWSAFQLVQGDASPVAETVPAVLGTTAPPNSGGNQGAAGSPARAVELRPVAKGDRGGAVRALQITLAALGYELGPADGVYQQGTVQR